MVLTFWRFLLCLTAVQNNHGWTALLAAAKRDNRELVEALLSLGANLHIANDLQRVRMHKS